MTVPWCIICEHYDLENERCPAFPEGVKEMKDEPKEPKECAPGIKFEYAKD